MTEMTVEDFILEEIAKELQGYYTTTNKEGRTLVNRASVIFKSGNRSWLERNARFFGGVVALSAGGPGSWWGDMRTLGNKLRGDYEWRLLDHTAYIFCRKILPHLAKHDQYRFDFCQALMMWYMANENHRHQQANS